MKEFSVEGVLQILGALKFREIFQKYALKLIKIRKIIEKIRKNENFSENFNFDKFS